MSTDDHLAISALQHYAYCRRQFALIHLEQAWSDNYFTAQGNVLHERVDSKEAESRGPKRFERAVSVQSERLRLQGKLDLLEIITASTGPSVYLPVEYKRGKHKVMDWDRIQLCAQALCLEEMLNTQITSGALWYWQERKREAVDFSESLRQETIACIEAAHAVMASRRTPAPTTEKKRCKACSLIDICSPDVARKDWSAQYVAGLYTP